MPLIPLTPAQLRTVEEQSLRIVPNTSTHPGDFEAVVGVYDTITQIYTVCVKRPDGTTSWWRILNAPYGPPENAERAA